MNSVQIKHFENCSFHAVISLEQRFSFQDRAICKRTEQLTANQSPFSQCLSWVGEESRMPVTLTQNSGDRAYGMPGFYRALVLTTDAICLHDKHHVNGTEGDHFTRGFSLIRQTPTFAHGKVNCRSGEGSSVQANSLPTGSLQRIHQGHELPLVESWDSVQEK